ncbi:CU044_5270 family protein [Nonomuraea sp. NPDC050663]|uniref:CU044_5270 family protein n=1 Tax=Nonomuraea sp. NPDC050663 TaxID=3364370 RepID=UPI0037B622F2
MNQDQIFRNRARALDEDLTGSASTAGADALLAEIVSMERAPARRRLLRPSGRALLGLTAMATAAVAAAAAVVAIPALQSGTTTLVPQPATSSSVTAAPEARQILLAAAVAMEQARAEGDYWRTATVSQSMLLDPTRTYVIERKWSKETWLAKRPDLSSWWINRYLGAEPATPRDKEVWRAAGAPTSWRYPRNLTENRFAVPFKPLEAAAGERTATRLRGKWTGSAGDLMGELMTWRELDEIPGNPEELRGYLEERISRRLTADAHPGLDVEQTTANLLRQGCVDIISRLPASPEARASAYRVLASLPGIRAVGESTDPLGRNGQTLSYQVEAEPGLFTQVRLLIDPSSGLPLSEVWTNTITLADGRTAELRSATSFQTIGWTDDRPDLPTQPVG